MNDRILGLLEQLKKEFNSIENFDDKVNALNLINSTIFEMSPFDEPVGLVKWIPMEKVHANSWNPNAVAPPEMKLLYDSIKCDGYTQPIVAYHEQNGEYETVDGYHRNRIEKEHSDIKEKLHGYLPIVELHSDKSDRMASTIRHNRARGSHDVDLMSNIVGELHEMGRTDTWIAKHLGMDLDEILRLKQITGLADLFKNNEFSQSWDIGEDGVE